MSGHSRWERMMMAPQDPAAVRSQLAYVRGYIVALEDMIEDLTEKFGSTHISIDEVIDHLDLVQLEAMQTLGAILEMTPMQEAPDETSG